MRAYVVLQVARRIFGRAWLLGRVGLSLWISGTRVLDGARHIPSSRPSGSYSRNPRLSTPWERWRLCPRWRCIRAVWPIRPRRSGRFRVRASVCRVRLRRGGGGPCRSRLGIGSSWQIWRRCRPVVVSVVGLHGLLGSGFSGDENGTP